MGNILYVDPRAFAKTKDSPVGNDVSQINESMLGL